jgi:uncharacterized protein (TIGR00369 family)
VAAQERVRVIEWEDPLQAAAKGLELSGLEALQAIGRGDIPTPPLVALMGIEGGSAEEGEVFLGVQPAEYHYSTAGAAHGGLAATLLDSAMYGAVHSTLPQRVFASTLEIKINYVRPITVETGYVLDDGRGDVGGYRLREDHGFLGSRHGRTHGRRRSAGCGASGEDLLPQSAACAGGGDHQRVKQQVQR